MAIKGEADGNLEAAPVVRDRRRSLPVCSRRGDSSQLRDLGGTAEHDTASKDSGFATVVVGHLGPGRVDENAGLSRTLATRQLAR